MDQNVGNVKTQETGLVISAGAQLQTNVFNIFKDIDFSGLSAAIEAIGDHTGELEKDEKDFAIKIIGEWEDSVISRLNNHSQEMSQFVNFFSNNNYYGGGIFTDQRLEALADQSNTRMLYDAWQEAKEALNEHDLNAPESPWLEDPDLTYAEKQVAQQEYRVLNTKHGLATTRLTRKVNEAERTWKKAVNKDEGVKELIAKAQTYVRNVSKYSNECSDKSRLAKLNISIASKDVRASLKGLMDFAIGI